jgi:23S rRNA (cytidine1920-2'-O)/16S rRNA (cytidine1409-2'-O)-methyltransferase
MRADQLLVRNGLAPTRSAAQRLIACGAVRWLGPGGWAQPRKAGEELPDDATMMVTDTAELRYASRGGLKLEAALRHCRIDVQGMTCLDVGQGTGGFTDVLLQQGAARVIGIEVGHRQLHPRLAGDARVRWHEGINARDLQGTAFADETPAHSLDFITGDLSFISLTLVLPALAQYLAPHGHMLMLVKPQFELQPQQIGKGGIVKDTASYRIVEDRIRKACRALALQVDDYFTSAVTGGDGNTEFFVRARPKAAPGLPQEAR